MYICSFIGVKKIDICIVKLIMVCVYGFLYMYINVFININFVIIEVLCI